MLSFGQSMTPSNESILLRRCNKSVAGLNGVNTDSNDFFVVCGVLVVIHCVPRAYERKRTM